MQEGEWGAIIWGVSLVAGVITGICGAGYKLWITVFQTEREENVPTETETKWVFEPQDEDYLNELQESADKAHRQKCFPHTRG